jgi:hypothetical protein
MRSRVLYEILILTAFLMHANPSRADVAGPFEPLSFDEGLVFTHPEGRYKTALRFRIQNLAEVTTRSGTDLGIDEIRARVRRARIRLGGYAVNPRLTYQLQLSFSREDQDWNDTAFPNILRDANVTYAVIQESGQTLSLSFGQGKLPGNRQRVISSGDLQFADRSLVNRVFNIDRDFGFQTFYRLENWNLRASVSSGEGRNLSFPSDAGLAWVVRAEWLPFGSFEGREDYVESDLKRHRSFKLGLGATRAFFNQSNRAGGTTGAVYTTSGNAQSGTPVRRDQSLNLLDAIAKYRGWSIQAEYGQRSSPEGVIAANQALFEGSGWMIQSGYLLTDRWELACRFARISPDHRSKIDPKNLLLAHSTLGINHYLDGHRVKVQADITRQSLTDPAWIGRFNLELGI